jgi:Biotin carboxylase
MSKKKLAIIGASYLQEPLIEKAKCMGLETHVFAWKCGDIGEKTADFFYPISIIEKDEILQQCKNIGVDGICSIASDLASVTVNYVGNAMGLTCNSLESTHIATNKHAMRTKFMENMDPSPRSWLMSDFVRLKDSLNISYPLIVKPTDRSGSRGITKINDESQLEEAIGSALSQSFEKEALVEEFANGQEYSVECISYEGNHQLLAITKKYTTGAPHFIETGHVEPAPISRKSADNIKRIVFHALNSLQIKYGASHSEVKIDQQGNIKIIEIGGRMGGDFIGSDLVQLSTGYDFVKAVIEVALGNKPETYDGRQMGAAATRFILSQSDLDAFNTLKREHQDYITYENIGKITNTEVSDSSTRLGSYIFRALSITDLERYLPK